MAVRLAQEAGLLLVGFANGERFVAYTQQERLRGDVQGNMNLHGVMALATSDE